MFNNKAQKGNAKRLARNTLFLYIRSFITLLIALYTSRVVLASLGVEDYGLYNVIGGIVSLITIITSGLAAATQRFLSYELGRGDKSLLNRVFSVCLNTHFVIAGVFLLISLSLGMWFVIKYLEIPSGRMTAAVCVFVFSCISIVAGLIIAPFQGLLISHEKLNVYAYLGIADAILKLIIAFIISTASYDRLIYYGFLLLCVSLFNFIFYLIYCWYYYPESRYKPIWDKMLFKRILSFASWTVLGQGAMVGANQGTNILINIFHTVRSNAALGIATQVNGALTTLTSNFFVAYQPQIVKSYAQKEYNYMTNLIHGASKLSFFLLFIVSIPVLLNLDTLLSLWLVKVPENTNIFCIFFILSSIINSLGNPAWTGVNATGNIKRMYLYSTILYVLDIVIIFILFRCGLPAYAGPATKVFIDICLTIVRLFCLKQMFKSFSIVYYFQKVLLPIGITIIVVAVFIYCLLKNSVFSNQLLLTLVVCLFTIVTTFHVGLSGNERNFVVTYVKSFVLKLKNFNIGF